MKNIKGYILGLSLLAMTLVTEAQDFSFSQYHNTPYLTNPAMLGSYTDLTILANYRSQRLKSGEQMTTPMLSVTIPTKNFNFGITLINDDAAKFLVTNGVILGGAFNLPLGSSQLSLGAQAGIFQRRVGDNGLTTDMQYFDGVFNPELPTGENIANQKGSFLTAGAGAYWSMPSERFRDKAFVGVSALNINQPDDAYFQDGAENKIPMRISATAGVQVYKTESFSIMPNARYISVGDNSFFNAGSWFRYHMSPTESGQMSDLSLGLWYNNNQYATISAEWEQNNLVAALSYDLPMGSGPSTFQDNGVFEVTFGLKFGKKKEPTGEETVDGVDVNQQVAVVAPAPQVNADSLAAAITKEVQEDVRKDLQKDFDEKTKQLEAMMADVEAKQREKEKAFFRNNVRFDLARHDMTLESKMILADWVQYLTENPNQKITLIGHTCDLGEEGENHELSKRRADEIKTYLVEAGIDGSRISTKGAGAGEPFVPNTSETNRRLNRRVMIEMD